MSFLIASDNGPSPAYLRTVTEQGGLTVTPIHARGEMIGKPWPE
jgi:hypothetical protein